MDLVFTILAKPCTRFEDHNFTDSQRSFMLKTQNHTYSLTHKGLFTPSKNDQRTIKKDK